MARSMLSCAGRNASGEISFFTSRKITFSRMPQVDAKRPSLKIKSKIWIEDQEGKAVFGAGRMRILSAVEEHGSILAASKALGMSYRAVWGKIKAAEERLGQPILEKQTGGVRGGGSTLTPFGRTLTEGFRQLEDLTRVSADTFFLDVFNSGMQAPPDTITSDR
jgi:molybdate transport system regulatory protein